MENKQKQLKVYSWNCEYYNKHKLTFPRTLDEIKPDAFALQSVNLYAKNLPSFKNYQLIFKAFRKITPIGKLVDTAIYANCKLETISVASPIPKENNMSTCAAKIKIKAGQSLTIINVYYPLGASKHNLEFLKNLKSDNENAFNICGDFNHHSAMLASQPNAICRLDRVSRVIA